MAASADFTVASIVASGAALGSASLQPGAGAGAGVGRAGAGAGRAGAGVGRAGAGVGRVGAGVRAQAGVGQAGAGALPPLTLAAVPHTLAAVPHTLAAVPHTLAGGASRRPRTTTHALRGGPATPAPMFAPLTTPFPPAVGATACPIIARMSPVEPIDSTYASRAYQHTTAAFASTGFATDATMKIGDWAPAGK
jgi:hypothetical protein